MHTTKLVLRLSAYLLCAAGVTNAAYAIQDTYDSTNFFDEWSFFTATDPTHGFVDYVSLAVANSSGLAGYANNGVMLTVDSKTVNPAGGRASTRLTSNKPYQHGLFIADIAHMPGGICGVWPAFWTVGGGTWPANGEIDIIEGVNLDATDSITLHTSANCSMSNTGSMAGSVLQNADCNTGTGFTGCSSNTTDTRNFGAGFNFNSGGVYAMEWTSNHIQVWFFPRGTIPADITAGTPDPTTWALPQASFSGTGCDIDKHFSQHQLVFDTTFCGDWAGNAAVWSASQCSKLPGASTCAAYVGANPQAFEQAYWLINSVKVYQAPATAAGKRDEAVRAVVFRA